MSKDSLGEVHELAGRKVRVLEGQVRVGSTDYKLMHDIDGLCAFVGRTDSEKDWVMDSFPVFYPEGQTETRVGIVLLCDLLRDFTVENRIAHNKFVIGNVDSLREHVATTYGKLTLEYVDKVYLNRKLGGDTAKFLAKRLARYVRTNYPNAATELAVDGRRIVLTRPHKNVVTVDDTAVHKTLLDFALSLGRMYLDAKRVIAGVNPQLLNQQHYFTTTEEAA